MKNSIKLFALAIIGFTLVSHPSSAQLKNIIIPENGYWQLVTNKTDKNITLVQFYTGNKELIYEEKVNGRHFNLKTKKNLLLLKEGLEKAINEWKEKREVITNQQWIANALKS
jgi:hypothetical protein